jgi:hypothetical protein
MRISVNGLTIWIEDGEPRFQGKATDSIEARGKISHAVALASEWIDAIDERERHSKLRTRVPTTPEKQLQNALRQLKRAFVQDPDGAEALAHQLLTELLSKNSK